jgi:Peptidase family M48
MKISTRRFAYFLLIAVAGETKANDTFSAVVDKVIEREQKFVFDIKDYTPIAETYVQVLRPDPDFGRVPQTDHYFIRRLDLRKGIHEQSFLKSSFLKDNMIVLQLKSVGHQQFLPQIGPEEISLAEDKNFDLTNYVFEFDRQEFLGEVKCLVINVRPRGKHRSPHFLGQIWVETRDYHIVRLNGVMTPNQPGLVNFHFDVWRFESKPGVWLPAFTYSEEADQKIDFGLRRLSFKSQTRFWGYSPKNANGGGDYSQIVLGGDVEDSSKNGIDRSSVENTRTWESNAESNILRRLDKDSLLSPVGSVEKALDTVVNNLLVSNDLDIQPDIHCRVLLTTPLESFTVGHTIVLSRGLLDVLPDENTLALMVAHELAHIALGHGVDTRYSFSDRLMYEDSGSFRHLHMRRTPEEEKTASARALEIMAKSPYGKDFGKASLFVKALSLERGKLPALLGPVLGSPMVGGPNERFSEVTSQSAELRPRDLKQIPALPLGSRIKLDPWNGALKLMKTRQSVLLAPREKMSFELTPVIFLLTRAEAALGVDPGPAEPSASSPQK